MLQPGDRVRLRPDAFSWANAAGDTGTYEGGEEYVPGLDGGRFTVALDKPNLYGHMHALHWTYDEVVTCWEKLPA